ncbi:uncharacterized protein E0L32_004970 [Thyridium curvatum]|uniref:Pre-mRNA-splicing factor 38B n=1 Tax=Thyridium curvatum TaxID=1093900 RepID=A0A507BD20_9PEZI|nr:uncharacterized protein E0L32_004970 [Thyridium curvatum]TPX14861.1 hypothetical protein E0L32_004970 [Thyridium curvatum]
MASKKNDDDILTDDYVAEVLASEARDCSLKYSALGLEGYKSPSRPANKSKPNTRFLRHIIKETKNHNEALLAKEAAESQARLQELAEAEDKKRRKHRPEPKDVRQRQLGDIAAILSGRKPRRERDQAAGDVKDAERREKGGDKSSREDGPSSSSRSREKGDKSSREDGPSSSSRSHRRDRDRSRSPPCRSSRGDRRERRREEDHKDRSRERRKRRHDTSDEGEEEEEEEEEEHTHRRSRRRRRERSRSPSARQRRDRRRERSPLQQPPAAGLDADARRERRDARRTSDINNNNNNNNKGKHASQSHSRLGKQGKQDDDSDPLEDIIGPAPPPAAAAASIPRGRGAASSSSGIDRRFSASYDPKMDVQPYADPAAADDWDDAVEAFRDRQKWKQQGGDRLREAGFSDDQIKKWEKGGGLGSSAADADWSDFQWTKKGEKREWDRGKTVGGDGETTAEADWTK